MSAPLDKTDIKKYLIEPNSDDETVLKNARYVSKDEGLTWTKRVGNSLTRSVYGGRFVDVGTSLSLITKRNQRTDGSSISPDVITIGGEGATTTIENLVASKINGPSGAISIADNINVSMGIPIATGYSYMNVASNNVTFSRLAYGNGLFVLVGDSKLLTSPDGITWTNNSSVTPTVFRGLAYGNGKFMLISNGAPSTVWTSDNGLNWTSGTASIGGVSYLVFGNGVFIAGADAGATDTNLSVTTGTGSPIVWFPKTITGTGNVGTLVFGAMSNGTNVFIATTASAIRRSIDNGSNWQAITNPTGMGLIRAGGFGNDIFMVCSFDYPGALSISRDGGLTWSASILFGFYINNIIYVEKNWYIGTESNIILTSNDDGVTWRKIDGPAYKSSAYGNSIFAVSSASTQSVFRFKTKRSDLTNITSDAITIGREGTTTTFASDKILVPPATITSEGGLTFSTDQQLIVGSVDYSTTGQRTNKVRIQTFSLSIMDPPSSYNGKNIVSGLSQGANSGGESFTGGEYTYTTGFAVLGNVNVNSTVIIGQTYKVVFTLKTTTTSVNPTLQIRNASNESLLDLGYIGTTYKTYVGYITPNSTSIQLGLFSSGASVQKTIVIKHFSLEALDSPNVLDVTGKVGITGYVGIGTNTPKYPLQAVGETSAPSPLGFVYFSLAQQTITGAGAVNAGNITIHASGSILTMNSFVAASDRRIKTNILDIDDDKALRDLRLLKPKTYTYTDFLQKGTTPVYGFIAQEVKEVLNYASSPITDTVPNVYELATFSGDTLTLTFNTADLSRDPSGALFPRLKLKTRDGKDEFVNILEILDAHTLRVDKDLTAWGGELIGDQIVPGNRIFVYGQEVNDFHTLNKDAIWTMATAALQEVDRQLQAEKQKTAAMQTDYDAKLSNLEARLLALETKV